MVTPRAFDRTRVIQRYESSTNTVFVHHAGTVTLANEAAVCAYFDEIVGFWRTRCGGRKAYYIVDYEGFSSDLTDQGHYAQQMRRVLDECAIAIVRYGGTPLQRATSRLLGLRLHVASNVMTDLAEAIEVVKQLRNGELIEAAPQSSPFHG